MADLPLQHIKNNQLTNITPDEYLALLTDQEWEHRQNTKISRLITQADFKQKATVADIDYWPSRNLDKNMFMRLASLDFLARKENVIVSGASGVGKCYLAGSIFGSSGMLNGQ